MPTLEPPRDDNNKEPLNGLPDFGGFETGNLTMEQSFLLNNYSRAIERCGDVEQLQGVTLQLLRYYIHSQNLIKTLMLDQMGMEMDKAKKAEILKNAQTTLKAAKKKIDDQLEGTK